MKPEQIDDVIFGNVLHAGLGQNVARQVAITAVFQTTTLPSLWIWSVGSGLKSIELAAQVSSVVILRSLLQVVQKYESASYVLKDYRWGGRLGDGNNH
ncbi:hypothetical protein [Streptococcus equi]|uniref:thiolase family protein n=1 Tax=Streptococcus equi TaxID=1336 RepID=UPI001E3FEB82|nr:hypothetical protein [Streptococcus equi]